MFQDEARFGRMSNPRACWAPLPMRPLVSKALVREYTYVYGAVTPADGALDWMIASTMNTIDMNAFLTHVSNHHAEEFVVMVVDGAPSHRSLQLNVPANMKLLRLPPYSPELNPAELLWDEMREKAFANRVFDSMGAVIGQALSELVRLEGDSSFLRSLTGWNWILESS